MPVIDLAVFAHNEEAGIAGMIEALAAQDLWRRPGTDLRVLVLANGCTDGTAARARSAAAASGRAVEVVDLPEPGKSRTWGAFVHRLSRRSADFLIFADADIAFPGPGTLSGLVETMEADPRLHVSSSRPVKDIALDPTGLGPMGRLIAAAGGTLDDWKTSVCGQLYILRGPVARGIHLPIGLPVEDGFVRAMTLTDCFAHGEDLSRIGGREEVSHVYASERHLGALVRHQVRLVIGGAVNSVVYRHLESLPAAQRRPVLAQAAGDQTWLPRLLRESLPARGYGWVPVHFLIKRLESAARRGSAALRPRALALTVAGFGFDAVVWTLAQIRMARGTGAGYW